MDTVLVTGATGYIGLRLVAELVREFQVVLLIRKTSTVPARIRRACKHAIVYDGKTDTLVSIFREQQPICVLHLASRVVSGQETKGINSLIESNILLGTQILHAMTQSNCRLIINTGTYWQHYGNEDYNPVNLYSATKQAFSDILRYFCEAEGVRAITLELYDVYGPDDPRAKLIPQLVACLRNGFELPMSPGEQILDLLHIDDVISGYQTALRRLLSGRVSGHEEYVLSGTERMSLRQVVERFEKVAGQKLNVRFGGRNYGARQVMVPWDRGVRLPDWSPKVRLEEGIRSVLRSRPTTFL